MRWFTRRSLNLWLAIGGAVVLSAAIVVALRGTTHWTMYSLPVHHAESIATSSPRQAWLVTYDPEALYTTDDGGRSWAQEDGAPPLRNVVAMSSTHLLGTTASGLYQSTDAGHTWREVEKGSFRDLHAVGESLAYALERGPTGVILWRSDNGTIWSMVGPPLVASSAEVCLTPSGTGWALLRGVTGTTDTVLMTRTAGRTWSTVTQIAMPPQYATPSVGLITCDSTGSSAWILVNGAYGMASVSYTLYRGTGELHPAVKPVLAAPSEGGGPPGNPPQAIITKDRPLTVMNPYALMTNGPNSAALFGECGPCGRGGTVTVALTHDGGTHWRVLPVPGAIPSYTGPYSAVWTKDQLWLFADTTPSTGHATVRNVRTPFVPTLFVLSDGVPW